MMQLCLSHFLSEHACLSEYGNSLCISFSLEMLCLPACVPLSASLSMSLSHCMQVFPALAQVQALRRVNECLLAENRAMLRILARLSETASMPETEDL